MVLSMDEIVNAVCLHQAERRGVKPTDVSLELSWDEDTGYTAEVWVGGRTQYLIEANLIEAILRYLYSNTISALTVSKYDLSWKTRLSQSFSNNTIYR